MIQVQTWLTTRDNSGARSVECIQTLGGGRRKVSHPGDYILVSVKRLRLLRKVKVGEVHLALITRARKTQRFRDGTQSSVEGNVALLRNRKKRVLGTRFFGWVSRRLRRKKFLRILLLCGRHVLLFKDFCLFLVNDEKIFTDLTCIFFFNKISCDTTFCSEICNWS